jgi:hypothetical protein
VQSYRCDLRDFLDDCLSFMQEQLDEAVANAQGQIAAVNAASGVIPLMGKRLCAEDPALGLAFLFVLGYERFSKEHWRDEWDNIARLKRSKFLEEASDITSGIAVLRERLWDEFDLDDGPSSDATDEGAATAT